jgi:hypothetical protein
MNNIKKLIFYFPKQKFIVLLFALALAFALSLFEKSDPSGPDALLYQGLGDSLIHGVGYIDNIRNDYILPPLMHPLIIGSLSVLGIGGLIFNKIFFFAGLFLSFLYLLKSTKSLIITSFLTGIITLLIPRLNIYGIEVTLFFSIALLFYVLKVNIEKHTVLKSIFLGIAIVFFILIRPVFLPAMVVIIPITILWLIKNKKLLKFVMISFSFFLIVYGAVFLLSKIQYKDSRLTSGTYSGITLYSGFNHYIDLKRTYSSDIWREIPEKKMNEGLQILVIPPNGTWQLRDKALKKEVLAFICQNPGKALGAYLWRLKKYTFATDIRLYNVLFWVWISSLFYVVIMSLKNRLRLENTGVFLIFSLAPIYLVFIQALFVYSGNRYLIVPALFFIFTLPEIIKQGNKMYWTLRAKKVKR